eukprot:scaffold19718_cov85-Skeletonema_marinoi.AAC.1
MTELLLSLALAFMFVGGSHLASRRVAVGSLAGSWRSFLASFLCPVSHNVPMGLLFRSMAIISVLISENTTVRLLSGATLGSKIHCTPS